MKLPPAPPLKPLDLSSRPTGIAPAGTRHDRLVAQARNWVGQTFFGTLLKQMEQSPFKSDLLSGGRGGQAFSTLYHQQLAQRMARGAGDKLVNAIVRKVEARAAYGRQTGTPNTRRVGNVPLAARA